MVAHNTAASLLREDHPLHKQFIAWCNSRGNTPTKRLARKFLQTPKMSSIYSAMKLDRQLKMNVNASK